MVTPGTSSKGSQSIAEWLPLLGSIVQALSGMAEDDRTAARSPAAVADGRTRPGTIER